MNNINIYLEANPNPNSLKFVTDKILLDDGIIKDYPDKKSAADSPLAKSLFDFEYIDRVFIMSNFITITKNNSYEWQVMKPSVLGGIIDHFNSEDKTVEKKDSKETESSLKKNEEDSDIVKQIKELLDTRVRPAVAMDGGDIIYNDFEDGVVYLKMQGACSGCPSSTATLKMGIENMLKHYIPEVQEVRPVDA